MSKHITKGSFEDFKPINLLESLKASPVISKDSSIMAEIGIFQNDEEGLFIDANHQTHKLIVQLAKEFYGDEYESHIWTTVEDDDNVFLTCAGLRFVNRMLYSITEEKWEDKNTCFIY